MVNLEVMIMSHKVVRLLIDTTIFAASMVVLYGVLYTILA